MEMDADSPPSLIPLETMSSDFKGPDPKPQGEIPPKKERFSWIVGKLRSNWAFIFLYFVYSFVHGVNSTYLFSVLTTLEKRFNLSSSMSGLLSSISTLGYTIAILLVSYYGRRGSLSKLFGVFGIVTVFSSILYILPHIIFGPEHSASTLGTAASDTVETTEVMNSTGVLSDIFTQYCSPGENVTLQFDCMRRSLQSVSPVTTAFALFVMSEILNGMTGAPILALGIPYLDNILSTRMASRMIGLVYGIRFMSPTLAFLLGSSFLSIHETLQDVSLSRDSPRWVGAWYLGYILCAIAMFLVAVSLLILPGEIKVTPEEKNPKEPNEGIQPTQTLPEDIDQKIVSPRRRLDFDTAENDIDNGHTTDQDGEIKTNVEVDDKKALPKTLWRLAKNPVYSLTIMGFCTDVLMFGYMVFIPKYLEVQFQMDPSYANLFGGVFAWLCNGCSSVCSGFLASKLKKSDIKYMSGITWICSAFTTVTFLCLMSFSCGEPPLARELSQRMYQPSPCEASCHCSLEVYDPVCSPDGLEYFSPCHAGCPTESLLNKTLLHGCSCFEEDGPIQKGTCSKNCTWPLVGYTILLYVTLFVANLYNVPATNVVLRSVDKGDKPMAVGILTFLMAFGVFPAPIMFGGALDSACIMEQPSPCKERVGQQGACLYYNHTQFRVNHHALIAGLKLLSTILYFIPWLITIRKDKKKSNVKAESA